jgi:hypothetical protein
MDPDETPIAHPNNPEKDLDYGLKEMDKARPAYEEAEKYYFGEIGEKYVSHRLRAALSGSSNDFQINLASRVVHAVTDRLEIAALLVTEDGQSPQSIDPTKDSADQEGGSVAQILNEEIWHENELDQEAPDVHLKAGYYGDAYMFMWPNEDGGLDIFMHGPKGVRVFYDIENPRKKRMAIHWWETEDNYVRVNLWYPDHCVKFITKTTRSKGLSVKNFQRHQDEDTDDFGVMDNPLGQVPFWHFRTDRPYGVPLHRNAYGPQDGITKLVRSMMTITDFASFPQRWALGETGAGSDDDFDWEDDETAPEDLASELITGPGRVWWLRNVKNVGQFSEANVDQTIKPLDKFIELMAASTGTPMTYLNKVRGTASTPLSGASQREMEASHLKRVRSVQRSFGATWRQMLSFAVEYLGNTEATVSVRWAPAYFRDDKETWDAVLAKETAGVPKRVALMEQDYTEAQVDSWGFTEEEPNGPQETANEFEEEQRKPVRPELRANNDGDTSRFNQGQDGGES